MGSSHDEFVKYPRTPHLFGSRGTDDDKHLGEAESAPLPRRRVADRRGEARRHERRHPLHGRRADGAPVPGAPDHRGDAPAVRPVQAVGGRQAARAGRAMLEDRFILFGEWVYARHSVHYRRLPHYFFEFDIYDKRGRGLPRPGTAARPAGRDGHPDGARCSIAGPLDRERLAALIGPSRFDSQFENPLTGRTDDLMEGLYLRTEAGGVVTGRAKFVRPEFVEKVKQSEHWQHQAMMPNRLDEGADIWS